jgi:protein disulfide-isomerase A5
MLVSDDELGSFLSSPKAPPPPEPEWSEQQTDVIHLTDENFKNILKKKKSALLFFYAPCTSMHSEQYV